MLPHRIPFLVRNSWCLAGNTGGSGSGSADNRTIRYLWDSVFQDFLWVRLPHTVCLPPRYVLGGRSSAWWWATQSTVGPLPSAPDLLRYLALQHLCGGEREGGCAAYSPSALGTVGGTQRQGGQVKSRVFCAFTRQSVCARSSDESGVQLWNSCPQCFVDRSLVLSELDGAAWLPDFFPVCSSVALFWNTWLYSLGPGKEMNL